MFGFDMFRPMKQGFIDGRPKGSIQLPFGNPMYFVREVEASTRAQG